MPLYFSFHKLVECLLKKYFNSIKNRKMETIPPKELEEIRNKIQDSCGILKDEQIITNNIKKSFEILDLMLDKNKKEKEKIHWWNSWTV
jgi:hypothetical protein